jgi:hypothetical protein
MVAGLSMNTAERLFSSKVMYRGSPLSGQGWLSRSGVEFSMGCIMVCAADNAEKRYMNVTEPTEHCCSVAAHQLAGSPCFSLKICRLLARRQ